MKKEEQEIDIRVKKKVMGWRGFFASYGTMMLLVGIQMGIIVFSISRNWNAWVQVSVIMGYWAIVAFLFGAITNRQIKEKYDVPMHKLSSAAKKVAEGDFSIYVEPVHTPDQYDYLDVMFVDFNKMVQELGSIETLKNDFVANVSHEIKTPLAIIKNYTGALDKENLSAEELAEYIDTISKATEKLSALVSNILKLNKLDNQEIDIGVEEYDVCSQLCECALNFESLWEQKNIHFKVAVEDMAIVRADRDMLEIVWNNLLSNALKFTSNDGDISLFQTSNRNTITVVISDTGCGMNKETQKRIFDKFYQGETSHSGEGNGLGLALAYRVVEKLGGTLTVASEVNSGSSFTVTLPVHY
jgi:Signal transduction histidine kinase